VRVSERGAPKSDEISGVLKKEDIETISGIVPHSVIELIYKKIKATCNYNEIQALAENLIFEGYDVQQLLGKVMQFFIDKPATQVSDVQKAQLSEIIAETDFKMIQGGNEELNLLYSLSSVARIMHQQV